VHLSVFPLSGSRSRPMRRSLTFSLLCCAVCSYVSSLSGRVYLDFHVWPRRLCCFIAMTTATTCPLVSLFPRADRKTSPAFRGSDKSYVLKCLHVYFICPYVIFGGTPTHPLYPFILFPALWFLVLRTCLVFCLDFLSVPQATLLASLFFILLVGPNASLGAQEPPLPLSGRFCVVISPCSIVRAILLSYAAFCSDGSIFPRSLWLLWRAFIFAV